MLNVLSLSTRSILVILPFVLFFSTALSDFIVSLSGIFIILILLLKKDFEIFKRKYFIFFFIFCLYILISSILSNNVKLSLESSLFYFRFGFFGIALVYSFKTSKNFIKYLSVSFILSTSLVAFDGIYEFIFNDNFLNFLNPTHEKTSGRISGVFGDEYILGSYLVRLLPISLGLVIYIYGKSFKLNIFIFLYSLLISIAILISGERTALLMLLIIFILILMTLKDFRKIFSSLTISFLMIFSVFLIFDSNLKKRLLDKTFLDFYQLNNNINIFSIQHEVVYKSSLKIFYDNKYIGIGPKIFREECKKEKYKTFSEFDRSINGCQTHPHNTYIQILTETGIFGFIIFLFPIIILYYKIFINIYKNCFREIEINKILSYICLITIFTNFWPLMPTGNFFNNYLSILYFLPIALYFAINDNLSFNSEIKK